MTAFYITPVLCPKTGVPQLHDIYEGKTWLGSRRTFDQALQEVRMHQREGETR